MSHIISFSLGGNALGEGGDEDNLDIAAEHQHQ
jgi:hypothetical protein